MHIIVKADLREAFLADWQVHCETPMPLVAELMSSGSSTLYVVLAASRIIRGCLCIGPPNGLKSISITSMSVNPCFL